MKRHDYTPVRLSSRAEHPIDVKLVERQKQAAAKLGPNSIKRVLIEDQPDTWVTPLDYNELGVIE